jgi:hypothetical protein
MNSDQQPTQEVQSWPGSWGLVQNLIVGAAFSGMGLLGLVAGFWMGSRSDSPAQALIPLSAATADSTDSMAVATGLIGDDMEGVFFIDFNTGDLQCLAFYPRSGAFGAQFYTNVRAQLGGVGKNSKYLIATGFASQRAATAGARPASSLVYVTDINTGMFAAYAVPWDRNAEATGRAQVGPLVYVGGGPIRNYQLGNPQNAQPPAVVDPNGNRNP